MKNKILNVSKDKSWVLKTSYFWYNLKNKKPCKSLRVTSWSRNRRNQNEKENLSRPKKKTKHIGSGVEKTIWQRSDHVSPNEIVKMKSRWPLISSKPKILTSGSKSTTSGELIKILFLKIYLFKITNSFYTFKTWRSEVLNLREKLLEYSVVYGKTPIV